MAEVHPLHLLTPYQEGADQGLLILRDGSTAAVRPAGPEDGESLHAFFQTISPTSMPQRFRSGDGLDADQVAALCTTADSEDQLTLVVTRGVRGTSRIIGVGSYFGGDKKTAEFVMAVEEKFRGRGLGTLLLERLALLAVRHGFDRFLAFTPADNRAMLELLRKSGFHMEEEQEGEHVKVELSVLPGEETVARSEMRDRVATAASLRPFFEPNAVAVVGASRDPAGIGFRVLEALVMNRFQGPVYPVNPKAHVLSSIRAFPSVQDLPEPVDLAVIVVPREAVLDVVDDCAARGVRALVVISAGFAEADEEGRRLQDALVERVRGYGMRMVGPNCLGLLNTDPEVRLNASFSRVYPPSGRIAMGSQSGALGQAILALARHRGLGLSTFVSVGNKADVSGNDLLQYWEVDDHTKVILFYLESFGNPRRFARIARRVSRTKPIVAVKSGRTSAGTRAAGSHTAALAASEVAVDALFHQTGVIRAETLEEMFDLAAALDSQPPMQGRRVGIVTNAGGPGILCADACEAGGLRVPELGEGVRAHLAEFLPAAASLANPVDMIASASAEHYRLTVEAVLSAGEIDALIVLYIPVGIAETEAVTRGIMEGVRAARSAGATEKPVLACVLAGEEPVAVLETEDERIPVYAFPEAAARVLSKVADHTEWRAKPMGMVPDYDDLEPQTVRETCEKALGSRGAGWLSVRETREVLEAFKLPAGPGDVATSPEEAIRVAQDVGYPVAVKLASHKIVHKTELGAVHLNVINADGVRQAFGAIREAVGRTDDPEAMEGVLVQPMVDEGVEVMVGVAEDPLFGPLIAFGLGGIHVEILGDVSFRVTPLTDQDAREMVQEIRGHRLLEGYRGHPPADIEAIEEVLLRVSRLVEEVPEIVELDLNPIFALPPGRGCRIVDARIRVTTPSRKQPARYGLASGLSGARESG